MRIRKSALFSDDLKLVDYSRWLYLILGICHYRPYKLCVLGNGVESIYPIDNPIRPPMNTLAINYPFLWPLIKEILIGTVLLLIVLVYHGGAINHVIMRFERMASKNMARKQYNWVFFHFYVAFNSIALIHIIEVLMWAAFLLMLGLIDDGLTAIIFSGSCYTTVGFGEDSLPHGWKTLAFFIAFTGLFSLAWTTSGLMSMTGTYRDAWRAKYLRKHQ